MIWSSDTKSAPVGVDLEVRLSDWDPTDSPLRTQAFLMPDGEKRFRGIWAYGDVHLLWRIAPEETELDN